MNCKNVVALVAVTLAFVAVAPANGDSIILYNTGVSTANNSNGSNAHQITTSGVVSPNWTVSFPPGTPTSALTDYGTLPSNYTARDTNSGYVNDVGNASVSEPVGSYVYSTTFSILPGFDPSTAAITGEFAEDDQMTKIELNGQSISVPSDHGFSNFTAFSIPVGSDFLVGTNTLTFTVFNSGGPTALDVTDLAGTVLPATAAPLPSSVTLGLALLVACAAVKLRVRSQAWIRGE